MLLNSSLDAPSLLFRVQKCVLLRVLLEQKAAEEEEVLRVKSPEKLQSGLIEFKIFSKESLPFCC